MICESAEIFDLGTEVVVIITSKTERKTFSIKAVNGAHSTYLNLQEVKSEQLA
jgi:hypothetical protein